MPNKNKPTGERRFNGDLWPQRDRVCFRVAYKFEAADSAIRRCRNFNLAVQAGGCVGAWPKYLKNHFSRVVTFEPSPENFGLLKENLKGFDIEYHHAALGARPGRCGIKENPKNCGDDQTIPGGLVEVVALDDLNLDPDLIYLDIQGDELAALKGAFRTVERCSPIVGIEVDNKLKVKGDAEAFLRALGYQPVEQFNQDLIFERTLHA